MEYKINNITYKTFNLKLKVGMKRRFIIDGRKRLIHIIAITEHKEDLIITYKYWCRMKQGWKYRAIESYMLFLSQIVKE